MQSAEHRAFLAAACAWSRSGNQQHALRLLRSPLSGVPNELACAYAALSVREGPVIELIDAGRLCAGDAQHNLLAFVAALRELSALAPQIGDEERVRLAGERFGLGESAGGDAPAEETFEHFELGPPAAPEAPRGVQTQHLRFSASQLNAFGECPRKWFYRYVCGAVEDKGSAASYYGSAFHAALEHFHAQFPRPRQAQKQEMDLRLQGYVNAAFENRRDDFETAVERELQVRRARRTAHKYVEWLATEAARTPFTVIGCELSAELQLEGFDFVGYIDRLDQDEATGAVSVIDYKTGSIARSAAEYRDKVRAFKDFQLPFYYWARTAAGDRVTKLALVPLKDALLDVRPISLEVVPGPRDIVRSQHTCGVIPLEECKPRAIA